MHKIQFKFQKSLSGAPPQNPPQELCLWTQLEDFRSSEPFYNYVIPLVQFLNTPLGLYDYMGYKLILLNAQYSNSTTGSPTAALHSAEQSR